jgi:hypothetical protein
MVAILRFGAEEASPSLAALLLLNQFPISPAMNFEPHPSHPDLSAFTLLPDSC